MRPSLAVAAGVLVSVWAVGGAWAVDPPKQVTTKATAKTTPDKVLVAAKLRFSCSVVEVHPPGGLMSALWRGTVKVDANIRPPADKLVAVTIQAPSQKETSTPCANAFEKLDHKFRLTVVDMNLPSIVEGEEPVFTCTAQMTDLACPPPAESPH